MTYLILTLAALFVLTGLTLPALVCIALAAGCVWIDASESRSVEEHARRMRETVERMRS